MDVKPALVRAARGLLDWSQADLAEKAGIGLSALRDFESGCRIPAANHLAALHRALEQAGVRFIEGNEPGVRLCRPRDPDPGLRPEELNASNDG